MDSIGISAFFHLKLCRSSSLSGKCMITVHKLLSRIDLLPQ